MSEYKINKNKNEIIYDGFAFKLDEIKSLLKKYNAELYKTIACPGEVKYVLTDEAKSILRQKRQRMNASDT